MKNRKWIVALALVLVAGFAMAADEVTVPNRLSTSKVGEWAVYKVPNDYLQKLTVVSREGEGAAAMVTVRVDDIYDGEVVSSKDVTLEAGEPDSPPRIPDTPGLSVSVDTDDVTVKDQALKATVIKVEKKSDAGEDDSVSEWWVANEVPVFGIVKKSLDGEVVFELQEFGSE